ncbi:hypothetical protein WDW89_18075 [Deltaproteobacteria bacterium TL4]
MEVYKISEARKNFSKIMSLGYPIEIKSPQEEVVVLPKSRYLEMEMKLVNTEMDLAELRQQGKPKYTTEQVEAMLAAVRNNNG